MSAISLKSITGITSITTPAGVDNQLTLHNNNTTEAVKLDIAGNLHFHNHLNITGVSTASNFKTGTSNLHNTGLNVQDLDVDGHTNLDNVSIAGILTVTSTTQYGGYKLSNNSSIVGELVGLSGSNDTGALALWSGGSKYVQLSAQGNSYILGGNVGINEGTPEAKLELDGRFRILDNSDGTPSTGKGLEISYYTSDDMADILSYDRGGGSYKKLQLRGSSIELKKNNSAKIIVGTGGNNNTVGFSTTVCLVTNAEAIAVRGYSSFKSPSASYAAIYTNNELNNTGVLTPHIYFNNNGANRGGFGYDTDNNTLILNNHTNLSFRTGANALNGTERLRIDSTGKTTIKSTLNGEIFRIETSAGNPGGTQGLAYMGFDHFPASTKPAILIGCEEDGNASYKGNFVVKLKDAAATDDDPVQRFKIDSSGRVMIGRASAYGSADADNLIVGDETVNEHQGITILSHSGKYGGIYFGDGAGSNPAERGKIIYDHPNDQLRMGTAGSAATKFYINSTGQVGVNVSPSMFLQVNNNLTGTSETDKRIAGFYKSYATSSSDREGYIHLSSYVGHYGVKLGYYNEGASPGVLQSGFFVSTSGTSEQLTNHIKRFVITSDGKIGINLTNPGDYNSSANNLVVHSSPSVNDAGITIRSNYAGTGGLYFADGTGTSSDKGYIAYGQANDTMYLGVNRGSKLQINSSGAFGLAGSNYGSSGQVLTSQGSGSAVQWATPASNSPAFSAKMSSYQNCSGGNVVQFNQEYFDTDGCYNTSTYRFTPNVAGNYLITFTFYMYGSSSGILAGSNGEIIHSNYGSIAKFWIDPMQNLSNQLNRSGNSGSVIIPFNGSSEYVYVNAYGLTTTGGTPRIDNNGANFSGMKLA